MSELQIDILPREKVEEPEEQSEHQRAAVAEEPREPCNVMARQENFHVR